MLTQKCFNIYNFFYFNEKIIVESSVIFLIKKKYLSVKEVKRVQINNSITEKYQDFFFYNGNYYFLIKTLP